MKQLAISDEPKACEWCMFAPATGRVVGTAACEPCINGGPRYRVIRALRRWSR